MAARIRPLLYALDVRNSLKIWKRNPNSMLPKLRTKIIIINLLSHFIYLKLYGKTSSFGSKILLKNLAYT